MALVVEKGRKSSFRGGERMPWMLSDYLKDDMSSCSSSGFRSFPRKQCCAAAVKNIIEKEKEKVIRNSTKKHPSSKPPKCFFTRNKFISNALQKASLAIINAVKLLPLQSNTRASIGKRALPRSMSKKLFKKSYFWPSRSKKGERAESTLRKNVNVNVDDDGDDEIERWISSGVASTEKYQPLDMSTVTNESTTTVSNSNCDAWSDITFSTNSTTSEYVTTSVSESNDVVIEMREKVVHEEEEGEGDYDVEATESVAASDGQDSVNQPAASSQNTWPNEGEKEQFSPVSVMDFPDSDEGSASPFTLRINRLKGSQERLMERLGRFESLATLNLQPVNLEGLFSSVEIGERSPMFSVQSCTTPSCIISSESEEEEEDEEDEEETSPYNEMETKVERILNMLKANVPPACSYKFNPESLLSDFFRENVMEKDESTLLKAGEDWLNGHYDKIIQGWKVKDKRQAYIRDMEEGGRWPRDTALEKEEVAVNLGAEVLANLVEEFLVECSSS